VLSLLIENSRNPRGSDSRYALVLVLILMLGVALMNSVEARYQKVSSLYVIGRVLVAAVR